MPAPPPLSEPAMVRATGLGVCLLWAMLLEMCPSGHIPTFPRRTSSLFLGNEQRPGRANTPGNRHAARTQGENPFKSRAYVNAARAIEALREPLAEVFAPESKAQIKGIGESLHEKVRELLATGRLAYYEELKNSVPPGLVMMLSIPGLGPKKVKALHELLGITTMEQLEQACQEDKVAQLPGFGEKTQANIVSGINFRRQYASRHLLGDAWVVAGPILEGLRQHPDVIRCGPAGSLRRNKEIIGDIDLLASSKSAAGVIGHFIHQPGVVSVSARGETKASVVLEGGIQADLRVVSDAEYPFALAYFTGSKEHNIVMRQRAIERGLRLNEYGLFKSDVETRDPALLARCRTEEEIFQRLGLADIPPELREDQGEFAAAEKNALPRLLEWTELKGSLHNHSTWSDGRMTLEEIAGQARELGCDYWAITDHSKSSFQANGLAPERLRQQLVEIAALNRQFDGEGDRFRFLTGSEVDILTDGRLDYDDELLAELDVVVASIHQGFTQSEAETTRRLIRAAQNPFVHILGHLTGRLLLEREPYKVNQTAVIDACAECGTWIELNASPHRFDMDWRLWHYAKEKGVKCAINCDAHRIEDAGHLRLGAGIARKGWLEKKDVINTAPLPVLREALRARRSRAGV
jgi:DNA polymerase (family 10)